MKAWEQFSRLTIVLAILTLPAFANGEVLKGHPYQDRTRSTQSAAGHRVAMSSDSCGCHGNGLTTTMPVGNSTTPAHAGGCGNCPPVTTALLRVWTADDATVYVNGVKTKPQHLAGVHRGSRHFSLTNLRPDQVYQTTVRVVGPQGQQSKSVDVQVGDKIDVYMNELAPMNVMLMEQFQPLHASLTRNKKDRGTSGVSFDTATTRSLLRFRETTGALTNTPDQHIMLRFHLMLHRGGDRYETFAVVEQQAVFKRGEANVPFYERTHPGEHLSATFCRQFFEKLPTKQPVTVRVRITAILPDGTERDVGSDHEALTIQLD